MYARLWQPVHKSNVKDQWSTSLRSCTSFCLTVPLYDKYVRDTVDLLCFHRKESNHNKFNKSLPSCPLLYFSSTLKPKYLNALLFTPDRGTKSLQEEREHSLSRLSAMSKILFIPILSHNLNIQVYEEWTLSYITALNISLYSLDAKLLELSNGILQFWQMGQFQNYYYKGLLNK